MLSPRPGGAWSHDLRDRAARGGRMAKTPVAVLPKHWPAAHGQRVGTIRVSPLVVDAAALDEAGVYRRLRTRAAGLTKGEARARLARHGPNVLARDRRPGILR